MVCEGERVKRSERDEVLSYVPHARGSSGEDGRILDLIRVGERGDGEEAKERHKTRNLPQRTSHNPPIGPHRISN
jgi:hypothetical protein